MALESSETLKIQKQNLSQSYENVRQSRGALMPTLNYSYTWLEQDVPPAPTGTTLSSLRQNTQSTSRLTLNQPLFRGLSEYAGLEISNLGYQFAEKAYQQEELNLYLDISELFYNYLANSAEIKNLAELSANLNSRVKELTRRTRIGRSDSADLLSAQSQAALADSELLLAKNGLLTSQENLEARVPGLEFEQLHDNLELPSSTPDLKYFLDRLEQRPDLQQVQLQGRSAEQGIKVARSGHLPSVDVMGNYYFIRPGVLQDVEWDVSLMLTLPLFEGGRVSSEVRQAASIKTQQDLALSRLKRQAEAEVKSAYHNYTVQKERLALLDKTVKLSDRNYQNQRRNYTRGIKSYLEVIQTEREYWDVRRTLDRTIFETKLAWIRLMRSIGERPL